MRMTKMLLLAVLLLSLGSQVFGIDNLKLNSKLDYSSDSLDGPTDHRR